MTETIQVTVHGYQDILEEEAENHDVTVTKNPDGSFTVTGPKEEVLECLDGITMGEKEDMEDIWKTCTPPVRFPYVWDDGGWDYIPWNE